MPPSVTNSSVRPQHGQRHMRRPLSPDESPGRSGMILGNRRRAYVAAIPAVSGRRAACHRRRRRVWHHACRSFQGARRSAISADCVVGASFASGATLAELEPVSVRPLGPVFCRTPCRATTARTRRCPLRPVPGSEVHSPFRAPPTEYWCPTRALGAVVQLCLDARGK